MSRKKIILLAVGLIAVFLGVFLWSRRASAGSRAPTVPERAAFLSTRPNIKAGDVQREAARACAGESGLAAQICKAKKVAQLSVGLMTPDQREAFDNCMAMRARILKRGDGFSKFASKNMTCGK